MGSCRPLSRAFDSYALPPRCWVREGRPACALPHHAQAYARMQPHTRSQLPAGNSFGLAAKRAFSPTCPSCMHAPAQQLYSPGSVAKAWNESQQKGGPQQNAGSQADSPPVLHYRETIACNKQQTHDPPSQMLKLRHGNGFLRPCFSRCRTAAASRPCGARGVAQPQQQAGGTGAAPATPAAERRAQQRGKQAAAK